MGGGEVIVKSRMYTDLGDSLNEIALPRKGEGWEGGRC